MKDILAFDSDNDVNACTEFLILVRIKCFAVHKSRPYHAGWQCWAER